jgi:hypothetical protein
MVCVVVFVDAVVLPAIMMIMMMMGCDVHDVG